MVASLKKIAWTLFIFVFRVWSAFLLLLSSLTALELFLGNGPWFRAEYPNIASLIDAVSLNIHFPSVDKALHLYRMYIRPLVEYTLSWLTKYYQGPIPPWFFDYVLINSIYLSRPLGLLFKELSRDSLSSWTHQLKRDEERKLQSPQSEYYIGPEVTKSDPDFRNYRYYQTLSYVASLPPVFYSLSLLLFAFGLSVVGLVLLIFLVLERLLEPLISWVVIGAFININPIALIICISISMLIIFEIFKIIVGESDLWHRLVFVGKYMQTGAGWLAVVFLLAVSPYLSVLVSVYGIYIYYELANNPTSKTAFWLVVVPILHLFAVLLLALIILVVTSITIPS